MYKIFTLLQHWLNALVTIECPPDPLSSMSLSELADLPTRHPLRDDGCAC